MSNTLELHLYVPECVSLLMSVKLITREHRDTRVDKRATTENREVDGSIPSPAARIYFSASSSLSMAGILKKRIRDSSQMAEPIMTTNGSLLYGAFERIKAKTP